jgi:threonylcarbamoyladenosine tRNA methylthiotransferase MtaB
MKGPDNRLLRKHMPKYKITTLGCKVNQSESDAIAKELESCGWLPAGDKEASEIFIINTCTVTQKASMQSRQAVRRAIRAHSNSRIVVTGCYAQTEPATIGQINGVHYIVGNADKHRIGEVIATCQNTANGQTISICNDIRQGQPLKPALTGVTGSRTRPFLKIQDGCNAFCTYCIVPYARGPSRSLPAENILEAITAMANAGYRETVLTGVHLGHYGRDLNPETSLSELLKCIEVSNSPVRVRLSSIEPLELTDDLITRVAGSPQFCDHFHIPLQSGDDLILKKMARPYRAVDFSNLVTNIRCRMPDAAIGVDTLIGFPAESDQAFAHTYELIRDLPITYLHVFPFSARPGTPAARYPDRIAPDTIKKRCRQLRELGRTKRLNFYKQFIGKRLEVMVESTRHTPSGLLKGLSSNYLPVLIDADDDHKNQLRSVRVEKLGGNALMGILL